jgi:hypothetical protein
MIDHKNKLKLATEEGKEAPRVSNYIGESILLICNNLGKKPNFSGYTYIEEMKFDGVVDCLAAVNNFDPDRTSNPFAYFTQIAWNAFIRRIQKEKKQTYIKHKNFQNQFLMNSFWDDSHHAIQLKNSEFSDEVIKNFEKSFTKAKKDSKLTGLERFVSKDE